MNRTIIRILGCCIAVFGLIAHRAYAASEGVIKGARFSSMGTQNVRSGYCSYSTNYTQTKLISKYNCGVGQTNNNRYNAISDCNGFSYCNETGVCCSNLNFFTSNGCTADNPSGSGSCIYTSATWGEFAGGPYNFLGCASGYYKNTNNFPCDGGTGTGITDYSVFGTCCGPCSGYRSNYGGTISGSTFDWDPATLLSNCESGWCWDSATGIGIATCRAYPDPRNKTFTDDTGTFTVSDGCPYVN